LELTNKSSARNYLATAAEASKRGLICFLSLIGRKGVDAGRIIANKAANLFKGEDMAMKRCPSGHYFDSTKTPACPLCEPASAAPDARTSPSQSSGAAAKIQEDAPAQPVQMQHTVGFMMRREGIDPTVGWLVCIEGPERGKDYRIRSERNFIGRSPTMDISVNDESISRENHACIIFNPLKGIFKFQPGESRGMVYHNDEDVLSAVELKAGDKITIGSSRFIFVPFAGVYFTWTANA
jgi:hypothetical protein